MKRIVMIGAGRVATHLGLALQKAGHEVLQVYSRTERSASLLAERLGVDYTTQPESVRTDADIYLTAVTDDALPEVATTLTLGRTDAWFVHTAGSVPLSVWEGKAPHCGVFYPMQTFSLGREVDFTRVPLFIEASSEEGLQLLRELGESLGAPVREANSEQRKYLHLAAVFACNFTNHMYVLSARLLEDHGIPFEVMLPLIDETAQKVHSLSPVEAQTGPAVRDDMTVIARHLDLIAQPEWHRLYMDLSMSIRKLKETKK